MRNTLVSVALVLVVSGFAVGCESGGGGATSVDARDTGGDRDVPAVADVAACVPRCDGRACGDDGCGGTCGDCPSGQVCDGDGACATACVPRCDDRACGDDGCGGTCGTCGDDERCGADGTCTPACTPRCDERACGPDGCGGACGACPDGEACDATGVCLPCTPDCEGRACGGDGCGGTCGACEAGERCEEAEGECRACAPACQGRVCGDDGCGGRCGVCPDGEECREGACVAACEEQCRGRTCGDDGCGGTCGTCPIGTVCDDAGACAAACTPDCAGRTCGDDGCGGACGACEAGRGCGDDGRCESLCAPECEGRACGADGCGGRCGECPADAVCQPTTGQCVAGCRPDCTGRSCGPNGCGGTCGACPAGAVCREADGRCLAECTPECAGVACGPDGCGGTCGACPQGLVCEGGVCGAPSFPAVDWCRFQWPLDVEADPLAPLTAYVRLFEGGVTERTTATDPDGSLVVELGVGPRGGDPSGPAWSFAPAEANAGWVDAEEPGNDEYWAALVAPPVAGPYDMAFRVTRDGGAHHVYCDRAAGWQRDGSEDGYQVADAAHLTVVSACAPDCPPTCGDGLVEAGETCDGDCPTSCVDGAACTDDLAFGSAESCDLVCRFEPITLCRDGDGCCPDGCSAATDDDCPTTCGDGLLEAGETCDGDCPSACDDGSDCSVDRLVGNPAGCTATCSFEDVRGCGVLDGCCPAGCTRATDGDCSAACGDGVVDAGETCDGDCATTCDDGQACTLDRRTGSPATCNAVCTHAGITECGAADGCCPGGCNEHTDPDCSSTCGDGFVDPGETCDGDCRTHCDDGVACTVDTLRGSPATCSATCSFERVTSCRSGDGCCPGGCDAVTDTDCSATCGNGVVEPGETCDGRCPALCFSWDPCDRHVLSGSPDRCSAECSFPRITECRDADGCCATGCDAARDTDCEAVCGNGVREPGETCDGDCPTECDDDGDACTVETFTGAAARCTSVCAHTPVVCEAAASECADAFTALLRGAACDGRSGAPVCAPTETRTDCGAAAHLTCTDARCKVCLNEGRWRFERESAGDGDRVVVPFATGGPADVVLSLALYAPDAPADGYSQLASVTVLDAADRVVAVSRHVWGTDNTALYDPCADAPSACDRGATTLAFRAPGRGTYRAVVSVINARRRVAVDFGWVWEDHWLAFDLDVEGSVVVDAALWRGVAEAEDGGGGPLPIPDGDAAGVVAVASLVPCRDFDVTYGQATVTLRGTRDARQLRIELEHDGVTSVLWDHARGSGLGLEVKAPLDAFAGHPARGGWRLRVVDDVAGGEAAGEVWRFDLDVRGW